MAYVTTEEIADLPFVDADPNYVNDTVIDEAIEYATALVNDYCGTTFESTAFSLTLDGTGTHELNTGLPHLLTVTACTVGDVSQTVSGWTVYGYGLVISDTNSFARGNYGQNIVITGTAGHATIPNDMKMAVKLIAGDYINRLWNGSASDRTLSVSNEFGTTQFAVTGSKYPTGMPQVDAILNRYRVSPVVPNEVS